MTAGRERLGVVYLFGGTHLFNTQWNLSDPDAAWIRPLLPGIVFFSPVRQGGSETPRPPSFHRASTATVSGTSPQHPKADS